MRMVRVLVMNIVWQISDTLCDNIATHHLHATHTPIVLTKTHCSTITQPQHLLLAAVKSVWVAPYKGGDCHGAL